MKYIFSFFTFLFMLNIALMAQDDSDPEVNFKEPKNLGKSDRVVFDFFTDLWLNAPDSAKFNGFQRGANVSSFTDIPFGKSNFSLGVGVGINCMNVYHGSDIFKDSLDFSYFKPKSGDFKSNKLALTYFNIPIEFRFRSKSDKVFRCAIGGRFGYLVNNHIKYVAEGIKTKTYNISDINNLSYGLTLRVGYKFFNLYAYYGLSTLFKDGKGEKLSPLSVGISIIPF